jgi:hypothetical protein
MDGGSYTGWVKPPIHMQDSALEQILHSNLSEPAMRHAANIVSLGYTVIPGVVSREHCQKVIGEFQKFYLQNAETFNPHRSERGILPRFTNLHIAMPILTQLFTRNKLLLEVQDFLFGRPTSLYTSLYYERGSEQPAHRDTPVFCTRPEYNYFGNTLYLEGAGDDNGCLEVLAGGHLVGELDRETIAAARYGSLDELPQLDGKIWDDYQRGVSERCAKRGLRAVKLYMNPGDCVIWHPQLPHGGTPIRDVSQTRHSFVFHTAPVGARVYHQNVFFHPSKAFPEMAEWKQQIIEGRAVVHHPGIAFGQPVHQGFKLEELNRMWLTDVESELVSTPEALQRLAA